MTRALTSARQCLESASTGNNTKNIVRAHRLLSDLLAQRGVYEEAANHAREAITLAADDPWAHHDLAIALTGLRRFTEAISSAKAAIRLSDGKYGSMHFALGAVYFDLKQWPEAVQAFTKAAELSPTDSAAAYNVAVSYSNSGYYSEAVRWYRETLRRDPKHSDKAEILQQIDLLSNR